MTLVHIVLVKVKDSIKNDEKAWAAFLEQLKELEKLPVTKQVVKELKWGPPVYDARSQGYNYGLYSVFESKESYEIYKNDEAHQNFSRSTILPNADR